MPMVNGADIYHERSGETTIAAPARADTAFAGVYDRLEDVIVPDNILLGQPLETDAMIGAHKESLSCQDRVPCVGKQKYGA